MTHYEQGLSDSEKEETCYVGPVRSICKWSGDDLLRQQNKKIKIMMVGWSVSMYYVMTQDHVGRVCACLCGMEDWIMDWSIST